MKNFIGPIVIVKMGGELITGFACSLELESLSSFTRHQRLLNGIQQNLTLEWSRMKIQPQRKTDVERNCFPVDSASFESKGSHHRMPRSIPHLARVVVIEGPGLIFSL